MRVPELRADVPYRQLPVLRHPRADPGRHQRRHPAGHRERRAGHPGRGKVHPSVPDAGHRHPAGRADAGAPRRTAAAEGHHRRAPVARHGGGRRQPSRPRRRRHGLRLRADRGHRLLPVRRVRRPGRGQRRPPRAGYLGPDPRRRRPGGRHRRGRRDLRPRRHGAPGLLEPPGNQLRALPRRLVAHHRPGPARARRHRHLPRHDDPHDQIRGGEHLPRRGGELPGSPSGGARRRR